LTARSAQKCELFCDAAWIGQGLWPRLAAKDLTGELCDPQYLISEGGVRPVTQKERQMAWKAPKIVEVPVGMEINMYMCATRK
jgi:coenzyme PQQ precursor peptide PqqA